MLFLKHRKRRHRKKDGRPFVPDSILSEKSPFGYAESFKTLRSNFNFTTMNGKLKKVMITSALPGEAKSSTCINLSTTLAEAGAKVVLVDCDLRKGSIGHYLKLKAQKGHGFSELIAGAAKLEDCLLYSEQQGFWILPAGSVPPNPSELLNAPQTGAVLDELADRFDYVVCDTSPVNVVSDALNVCRYCDAVLLVVRQNFGKREEIRRATASLKAVGANLIGCVMTRYSDKLDNKGYYYHSNYYYYNRYGDYGIGYDRKAAPDQES